MNSFSINRFWLMLRWLINVNRVRLLGFTIGIMFSTFLIQLIMFVFGSFEKVIPYLWSCVHFGSFLIPFVIPITVCLAYSSFTSIGNKQQRGTWLMIPATNLEKFLSLIVYVTVICGLCAIVGYILGDCLRMAGLWIGAQLSADPAMKASEVFNYNGVDGTYTHPGWYTVTQVCIRHNGIAFDCDGDTLRGIPVSLQPQRVWQCNAS